MKISLFLSIADGRLKTYRRHWRRGSPTAEQIAQLIEEMATKHKAAYLATIEENINPLELEGISQKF